MRLVHPFAPLLLALALALGACAGPTDRGGSARAGGRPPAASAAQAPLAPRTAPASPAPVGAPVVRAPAPGAVPTSPAGTSDRGSRLARPTAIGQIAPEDAPPPAR